MHEVVSLFAVPILSDARLKCYESDAVAAVACVAADSCDSNEVKSEQA